jgi:osmotically-inducible protein OsmY
VGGTGGSSGGSGSSASTVGGGFTGGGASAGGGYTGGTGSASGSTASGGFTGGTGFQPSSGIGGGSASTTTPNSANPFVSTYGNPLGIGMVDVTGKQTIKKNFGQAMYSVYSTATTGGSGTLGGLGGAGASSTVMYGYNTIGMGRTPYYTATLGDSLPVVTHPNPQLQASVTDLLQRTTSVTLSTPIKVRVEGQTVFLDGNVATPRDKRIIEGMIRLTPGVRDVVNNLEVGSEVLPQPKTAPAIGP